MTSRRGVRSGVFFSIATATLLGLTSGGGAAMETGATKSSAAQNLQAEGYERLLQQRRDGSFTKAGWNHYGPGYFELDAHTGILTAHGGMGLLWYSVREYGDFTLELEFMTDVERANSGVFLRVPDLPSSDDYIYHSWEIQIDDASDGVHHTGAVYDAEAPAAQPSRGPGTWNHFRIRFVGGHIAVELNDTPVLSWDAEPRGKVEDFATRGYIGLQNHDQDTTTKFRNIFIKSLD